MRDQAASRVLCGSCRGTGWVRNPNGWYATGSPLRDRCPKCDGSGQDNTESPTPNCTAPVYWSTNQGAAIPCGNLRPCADHDGPDNTETPT